MNPKAQAGLEYLLTYGWALVLVATVIGAMVYLVSGTPQVTFRSSDPDSILLKAGSLSSGTATLQLQNITGGPITVNGVSGFGGNCTLNGEPVFGTGIRIGPGGVIELVCPGVPDASLALPLSINYTDYAGIGRTASVASNSGASLEPVTGCTALEEGKAYVLSQDIVSTEYFCITLEGSSISLYCDGKNITGPGSAGIGIFSEDGTTGLVIADCEVSGFAYGIVVTDAESPRIYGNNLHDNHSSGLLVDGSENAKIYGNSFSNNDLSGIETFPDNDNLRLNQNQATGNGEGIVLRRASNATVENNNASDNSILGLSLTHFSNSSLSGNTTNGNSTGLRITYSTGVDVANHVSCGNSQNDIRCSTTTATGSGITADNLSCSALSADSPC